MTQGHLVPSRTLEPLDNLGSQGVLDAERLAWGFSQNAMLLPMLPSVFLMRSSVYGKGSVLCAEVRLTPLPQMEGPAVEWISVR